MHVCTGVWKFGFIKCVDQIDHTSSFSGYTVTAKFAKCCINSTVVVFQFLCPVEDTKQVYDQLSQKFPKASISSELEYVPHTLVSLSNELLQQAEKLIETLEDHIDVVRIYDNIQDYPSATCKLFGSTW